MPCSTGAQKRTTVIKLRCAHLTRKFKHGISARGVFVSAIVGVAIPLSTRFREHASASTHTRTRVHTTPHRLTCAPRECLESRFNAHEHTLWCV